MDIAKVGFLDVYIQSFYTCMKRGNGKVKLSLSLMKEGLRGHIVMS